jgi:DNA polymerase-3 subunit delta'
MIPPWLSELEATLAAAVDRGRFPHATLIHGAQGSGRRHLVTSLAARLLHLTGAGDPAAATEGDLLRHPDFLAVNPEPDKQSISVDQIRELIEFLQLTSHQRGAKLVLLYPADAMTLNAANGLLKTLEEPPAGSIIFLVAEVLSRLPPTIISRCQRVRVPVASPEIALPWLQQIDTDPDWASILELAGGAPLLALEMHQTGLTDRADEFNRDLEALIGRREDVIAVAQRWLGRDYGFALRWLYWKVALRIRQQLVDTAGMAQRPDSRSMHLQTVADAPNMESCFGYLRAVGDLGRLQTTGINAEMNLVRLLFAWYGGFHGLEDE